MFDKVKGMLFDKTETAADRIRATSERLAKNSNYIEESSVEPENLVSATNTEINVQGLETLEIIFSNNPEFVSGAKNDIYNVSKFSATLPDTLPSEERKNTLKNILTVAGFDIDDFILNGQNRISYLRNYIESYVAETNAQNSLLAQEIAQLEAKIAESKDSIANNNDRMSEMKILISKSIAEIEKISSNIS